MSVIIRPLLPAEAAPLAAWIVIVPLWQRYGVTADATRARLEAAIAADDLVLAAETEAGVCGFAWVVPTGAFGRSPYLRMIGVHPDRARSGIGARLLDEAEQRCGADDLFLLVSDFNTEAQAFYRRHGYTQIGAIPGFVLPDVTELIFRKRLRG